MYSFILLVVAFLFLSPLAFPFIGSKKKILLYIQTALFIFWNYLAWGMTFGWVPPEFGIPEGSDPEGSIFVLYFFITPIILIVLLLEILSLTLKLKSTKHH